MRRAAAPAVVSAQFPDAVTALVAAKFGVADPAAARPPESSLSLVLPWLKPGAIVALTGPSGSGKTRLLSEIVALNPRHSVVLDAIRVNPNQTPALQVGAQLPEFTHGRSALEPLIDRLLPLLTRCGLGEAYVLIRPAKSLSQGETFRLRLALALARPGVTTLVIDEFGAVLDDVVAKSVARNLRKLADALGLTIVTAAPRDNFVVDLDPDAWVRFRLGLPPEISAHREQSSQRPNRPPTLLEQIEIVSGSRADWAHFSRWHYRSHNLGVVTNYFCLRHTPSAEKIGLIIYGYSSLHAAQRTAHFESIRAHAPAPPPDRHDRKAWAAWINRHFRVLHRIVIDPRFRGAGLGAMLVRDTVRRVGVPFVECFTSLGGYSGFLEAANFSRLGRAEVSKPTQRLCDRLAEHGFDSAWLGDAERMRRWMRGLTVRHRRAVLKQLRTAYLARVGQWRDKHRGASFGLGHWPRTVAALRSLVLTKDMQPFYFLWGPGFSA